MCEPALLLSAASTGLGLAQQQAQTNAANAIQQQRAALRRRDTIAGYEQVNRDFFRTRADATREQTNAALKALAARESARVVGGARGVATSSGSVRQLLSGISAAEGRLKADQTFAVRDAGADASDRLDALYRSGSAAALENRSRTGPNYLIAGVSAAEANLGRIEEALNGVSASANRQVAGPGR